ncbi:NADH-quinone oxidoreductase subunit L [Ferroplasma sp.]|uniref:NADH-quinone oxidoreductase subunit 5 family protein n=1 Tax=Ferroplasma sp. TaxID=2591003 RepID=UPI00307D60B4
MVINIFYFIFLLPLFAFPLEYITGRYKLKYSGIFSTVMILGSLILVIMAYLDLLHRNYIYSHYTWFYNIDFGIYIDHLTVIMAMMVAFMSLMITLFALFYMKDDPRKNIYFSETSLFIAGMLGLVVSSNLVLFFLFWEIVGLCSYLLIGFWFFKPNAAAAAKKAFIVTRVGDLLFIIGMGVLYSKLVNVVPSGTSPLSIPYLINNAQSIASAIGPNVLAMATILFLAGAVAKSAQFPLHVWLPDSMEGPTTVSALIHAATMVTAGVYLVARLFPLFYYSSSYSLYAVVIIGSFTAFYAGILGIVVNDIKRIIAYSTISELGYMMAAIGLGGVIGYSGVAFGMYHLVIHAVFKALLFMGAGVILVMLLELRNVKDMGGLFKRMPATAILMLIGTITLAAIPPTAGYFSRDQIISGAYEYFVNSGNIIPWLLLLFGEVLTATYAFRLYFLVFLGKPRSKIAENAHDPKLIYLSPLIVLAFLSLTLGIIQKPFYKFIYASVNIYSPPLAIAALPVVFSFLGIAIAYAIYRYNVNGNTKITKNPLYKIVKNKFYFDWLYTEIIAQRIILPFAYFLGILDREYNEKVDSVGTEISILGTDFRKIETGNIPFYVAFLIIGMVVIFAVIELIGVI